MKLFRFVAGVVIGLGSCAVLASEPVNIVTSFPPGGLSEKVNMMLEGSLQAAGYKTNMVRFDNCKSAENWIKQNPKKPVVFDWPLVNQALSISEPKNPTACSVPLNQESVVTIAFRTQFQVCAMNSPENAMARWRAGTGRLGITATPGIHKAMAEQIVAELAPDTKIIMYKGNPALVQALASREIEFAGQFSNASSVMSAGAKCFLTLGDRSKAAKLGSVSVDDIKKNSSVAGQGYLTAIVGYNIDVNKIRPVVVKGIKDSDDFKKHFATGADPGGLVIGQNPEQQWREVESYLNKFKK
jgi:hypothetical protein